VHPSLHIEYKNFDLILIRIERETGNPIEARQ
jgi:hypothetical protein